MTRTGRRMLALLLSSACGLSALWAPCVASGSIVERVVAVVGDKPVLLTELRKRARPDLLRIAQSVQGASQQAAAETELLRQVLGRMIDERLEEQAADKARLSVSNAEIDAGIRQIATENRIDPKDVLAEARRMGLTEQDYRDEVRRQLLEGKLTDLRVRGRVRITEQDGRSMYDTFIRESKGSVDLRILALSVPAGASSEAVRAKGDLAQQLSERARAGEDFCALVKQYSDDASTKNACGSRGPIPLQALFAELQQAAQTLKAGETSAPIWFNDPSGQQAVLLVQNAQSIKGVPAFDDVREQMMQRAYIEATKRQRKLWLDELRRGVYVDIRL